MTSVPARTRGGAGGRAAALASACLILLVVLGLGASWGSVAIPLRAVARIIADELTGHASRTIDPAWVTIVVDLRLPRVILGMIVGAVLAVVGAVFQALFRNPLADPYLVGVSSGASFGASVAILFLWRFSLGTIGAVPLLAFAFAVGVVFLAYGVSRIGGQASVTLLILAGVALGSLFSSGTTLLMLTAPDAFRAMQVFAWIMGSLSGAQWGSIVAVLPFALLGLVVMGASSYKLNLLQLGDDEAALLGTRVERLRLVLMGSASLATAAVVSVSGIIGFVGLVVPHIVRLLWGPDHRFLVPMSAILGSILVILADGLARTLIAPREIPLGVVTACLGVPFFLILLRRQRRQIL